MLAHFVVEDLSLREGRERGTCSNTYREGSGMLAHFVVGGFVPSHDGYNKVVCEK